MSLSLKKRGRVYYAQGQVRGLRVHESLRTRDITVARALLRDLETRKLSGGRVATKLWKDFAGEFLASVAHEVKSGPDSTLSLYTYTVNRFSKFLEAACILEVEHVNAAVLAQYGVDRLKDIHPQTKRQVTQNTVRSDLRILHRVFSYAKQCGYVAENPVHWKRLKTRGAKTQPYTVGEVADMLKDRKLQQTPMLRAIVLTFLLTGLRISDVIGLSVKAVDFRRERIITCTKKRGKTTTLPLHPDLRGALEMHFACRTAAQQASEFVFCDEDGSQIPRRALTSTLRRLFSRCGIKGGRAHRFRDTFSVRLLEKGASLYDVAQLLAIDVATCAEFYSPYCPELQDRAAKLVRSLDSPGSGDRPESEKVVQFCAPLSPALGHFGEGEANGKSVAATGKP